MSGRSPSPAALLPTLPKPPSVEPISLKLAVMMHARRIPIIAIEDYPCIWHLWWKDPRVHGQAIFYCLFSIHLICVGWVSPSLGGYPGVWPHFLSSQSNLEGVWECWGFDLLVLRPFHFRTSVTFPNPVQCHPLEL